jgi:hypothetical protein
MVSANKATRMSEYGGEAPSRPRSSAASRLIRRERLLQEGREAGVASGETAAPAGGGKSKSGGGAEACAGDWTGKGASSRSMRTSTAIKRNTPETEGGAILKFPEPTKTRMKNKDRVFYASR